MIHMFSLIATFKCHVPRARVTSTWYILLVIKVLRFVVFVMLFEFVQVLLKGVFAWFHQIEDITSANAG